MSKRTTIAIVAIALLLLISYRFYMQSQKKLIMETVMEKYGDVGLLKVSKEGFSDISDKTVTEDGDLVTVTEAYYDKSRICIGLVLEGDDINRSELEFGFYRGNKPFYTNIEGAPGARSYPYGLRCKALSTDIIEGFPLKFDLKLVVKKNSEPSKSFSFIIPLDRAAADAETKEVPIMKSFISNNRRLWIKNALFTPSSTMIGYDFTEPSKSGPFSISLFSRNGKRLKNVSGGTINVKDSDKNQISSGIAAFEPIDSKQGSLKLEFSAAPTTRNLSGKGIILVSASLGTIE